MVKLIYVEGALDAIHFQMLLSLRSNYLLVLATGVMVVSSALGLLGTDEA